MDKPAPTQQTELSIYNPTIVCIGRDGPYQQQWPQHRENQALSCKLVLLLILEKLEPYPEYQTEHSEHWNPSEILGEIQTIFLQIKNWRAREIQSETTKGREAWWLCAACWLKLAAPGS